jgi:molecular chaperone GrpE
MAEKDVQDHVNQTPDENSGVDINIDENQATGDSELEKLKAELEASKDKYLRLVAEFDNFRRRSAKERIETIQTAGREVIKDMLDVLDDSDRAQKQLDKSDDKPVQEGVTLVFNKLRNALHSKGLKPMETIGKDFDVDLHEAITEIPAPTEELKGKVVDEVVKGYYLNDKIIRHAKVVVGK